MADEITTVGMLGGGVMGGGIAQVLAVAGYRVVLRDLTPELLDKTRETVVDGRFGLRGRRATGEADRRRDGGGARGSPSRRRWANCATSTC